MRLDRWKVVVFYRRASVLFRIDDGRRRYATEVDRVPSSSV